MTFHKCNGNLACTGTVEPFAFTVIIRRASGRQRSTIGIGHGGRRNDVSTSVAKQIDTIFSALLAFHDIDMLRVFTSTIFACEMDNLLDSTAIHRTCLSVGPSGSSYSTTNQFKQEIKDQLQRSTLRSIALSSLKVSPPQLRSSSDRMDEGTHLLPSIAKEGKETDWPLGPSERCKVCGLPYEPKLFLYLILYWASMLVQKNLQRARTCGSKPAQNNESPCPGSPVDPKAKRSTLTPPLADLIWRDESGHMRSSPIGEPRHPAMHTVSRLNLQDAPPITSQPMVGLIWSRSTTSSAKRWGRNTLTVSCLSLFTAVGKT
nr:hypothetical protein Iba_chr15cCG6960 [Ipomoea batatas]